MAGNIALRGGMISRSEFASTWQPYCDAPVRVRRRTHPRDPVRTVEVTMLAPCRKCAKCLQFRQLKWRERAIAELEHAHRSGRRSWWVTLTFSPVHLAGILIEASSEKGTADRRVDAAAYRHLQRYFKRLRKAGARFRYLAIHERGEEKGRSHYHLLIHELGPKPLSSRMIENQWASIVHCRLVQMETRRGKGLASYITKYATKSLDVRPRASNAYGKPPA